MHDELYAVLPDAVYNALDANINLGASARYKLQDACKKSSSGALYDATTSAPFGHQMLLSLPENAHFDPVKRGLALFIAGRSVGVKTPRAAAPYYRSSRTTGMSWSTPSAAPTKYAAQM